MNLLEMKLDRTQKLKAWKYIHLCSEAEMVVDVVFPGWVPFPYLALAKDTAGFIKALDIALNNYDFDTLIGGHLTRLEAHHQEMM
jgi:hypothetical protein